MNEFEKMRAGNEFDRDHPEIVSVRTRAEELLIAFNTSTSDHHRSQLEQLFGCFGKNSIVRPPFQCEFGKNVFIGDHCFLNSGIIMLDNTDIHIADYVMIGPGTHFYTPTHSLDYMQRRDKQTYSSPIEVEEDVWIGGHVCLYQDIKIGARSVVAAGSVVTRDVPPDTLVAGTPAKVVRQLKSGSIPEKSECSSLLPSCFHKTF